MDKLKTIKTLLKDRKDFTKRLSMPYFDWEYVTL